MIVGARSMIVCWAMGITQHRNAVATIREVANLALMRGSIGRPGAGLCPVRGHSNVQGDRTTGIYERSEEHTSELQSLMRISYAVFCLKKKKTKNIPPINSTK